MSTPAALSLTCGFLPPAHDGGALVAVFPPIGARHEHRSALGTGPRPPLVEQGGAQPLVVRQDGSAEPFAYKRKTDALDARARLPAVVQGETVAVIVVAAAMYQPADGPVLLVVQADDVIGHARPSAGWAHHAKVGRCSA